MSQFTRRAVVSVSSFAALAATSLALADNAAAHSEKATHGTAKQSVSIRFAPVAGKDAVSCGTAISGLGSTSQSAQLTDLRFYVSNVKLIAANGKAVPVTLGKNSQFRHTKGSNSVTMIDLENGTGGCAEQGTKATNAAVTGTVPRGTYVGVRWTVGVPEALNHTDLAAAPAPLNLTAMAWSWQSGRKFAKIEVTDPGTAAAWAVKTFFVHLGSTGCVGDPAKGETSSCSAPNRTEVRLARFNPAKQNIAVDVRALVADADITKNDAGAPGCMSGQTDPECLGVFGALGINWRADGKGTGKSPSGAKQTVFRAIAR